jgi:uncharacterized glyoxalase superfamily protein PhnB
MIKNRSVPAATILPHLVYRNVADAIAWLTRAFGFIEHYRYGEPAQGAQMHLGDAWIMLTSPRDGRSSPAQLGYYTQTLTIFVDDVDARFDKARSEGFKIVEELNETAYGERQFVVLDLEGHHWLFSKHVRDVSPDEWGAAISERLA